MFNFKSLRIKSVYLNLGITLLTCSVVQIRFIFVASFEYAITLNKWASDFPLQDSNMNALTIF